ncbi:MAG: alpha/beta fold hydrolase [Bacteroidota bacterium]
MKKLVLFLFLICSPTFASKNDFTGCWIGKIDIIRQELAIKICFENDSTGKILGKIDIPQQNAYNLNLSNISCNKDSISFDLIINALNIAKFNGKIFNPNSDTSKIKGSFRQMGMVGKFELEKYIEEPEQVSKVDVFEEEVEIHNGEVKLAGTFTRPKEEKRYPAIILISGSGLQNRDEEIYGFKIFEKISNELVKTGFATLRMDDRGVGGSTTIAGRSPTTFDFASDVEQMISFLKNRKDVDTNRIGLLGHSEGAIVAFIVSAKNKNVKFVISMAGPTIRGDSLILEQIKIQMKNQNAPDSLIRETLQDQNEIYNIIRKTKDFERAKEILRKQAKKQMEFYPEEVSSQISNTLIERNIQMQIESMRSEWFETFINLDPIDYLKQIECPVLLVFAEKDQQVPAEMNILRLRKLLKKKNFTIKTIANANHLFQKCKSGQMFEYSILPKKFAPQFTETLKDWLKTNVLAK